MIRDIVSIDEELCDGCGQCVPACAEGAVRIVNGKARLVSDVLCDGLGACLGHCPRGAIKIVRRDAAAFDEAAVHGNLASGEPARVPSGCPSSRFAQFAGPVRGRDTGAGNGRHAAESDAPSELTHWPVQLRLLPPTAPILQGARLLVAADCVPVAYAAFHSELLRDHAVVIACPKLDDTRGYVEKLADMIRHNDPVELTVAHMQVPCCTGILQAVLEARRLAGSELPVDEVVIGVQGQVVGRRRIPAESMAVPPQ
ncbi:MAG TPA: 4Fe-4S binding protein [Phycisphaerae bacterium]|nr:4Fe-4S binding protein [Phycisphaerae bacterium]